MSFHVPERARDTTHPQLRTTRDDGNNGAFLLDSPEHGWSLFLIVSDGSDPEFVSDRWEHVSVHARTGMVDWMTETALLQALLLRGSQLGARLFRNNCGVLQDARGNYVRYGVANPGGSDLIGWMPVTVTPEMVGQTLAVFLAVEAKGPRGNLRAEQRQFLKVVTEAGAVSGVVRSVEDLETLLAPWLR